jgi:hypothetical protein
MAATNATSPLETRLARERNRLVLSRAVEDFQIGLPIGAGAAAVLLVVHHAGVASFTPLEALSWGAAASLVLPAVGILARRVTAFRVATLLDERLALEERVSTALAAERGMLTPSPLHELLERDALRVLEAVPSAALRHAFRPKFHGRAVLLGLLGLALVSAGVGAPPLLAAALKPAPEVLTPREQAEREDAARAARNVREVAAKVAEEATAAKETALAEAAAAMARRADEILQKRPPLSTALAGFHRMGEDARRALEEMAGTTLQRMQELEAGGELSKADLQLQRLLGELMSADLDSLGSELQSLREDLARGEGESLSQESMAALKDRIEQLAKALEAGAKSMEGREGLKASLGAFGDPELLREMAERMQRLMETLKEQGFDPSAHGGKMTPEQIAEAMKNMPAGGGDQAFTPPTADEIQRMIDSLKEMQRLAELGRLAFCQGCEASGKAGGT